MKFACEVMCYVSAINETNTNDTATGSASSYRQMAGFDPRLQTNIDPNIGSRACNLSVG